MSDECGDNRFEIIENAKKRLCQATNVEDSPTEWAVVDSFLFRMWQMGWLPGCEPAERACKVEWKYVGGDVAAGYCECGMELDRCHDYEPAHLPNHCPRCGVKVVE